MSHLRVAVLVEGVSDREAVRRLAEKRGLDLGAEGVDVIAIGGSKNFARHLVELGPRGANVRVAGLYDAAEEGDVRRGLERSGLGPAVGREDLERRGFFVCAADLEDELIRALGPEGVQAVLGTLGHMEGLRIFQRQPGWRDRPVEAQLRRFLGTLGGRKIAAAPLMVEALDPGRVPAPLGRLLDVVEGV